MLKDPLKIADKTFGSRLIIGMGKFPSDEIMKQCLKKSKAEMITVSVRRVDLNDPDSDILSVLDPKKIFILPNTSGAQNGKEAVRIARLAKSMGLSNWVKLEVTPDPNYLLPDPVETFKAAKELIKDKFVVLPYINADPVLARRLEEIGTATVMPLAAPIGSNKGFKALDAIKIIIEQSSVPVIVDAGIGKPSDACIAMEAGADAVMINTAISTADDPVQMAEAFRKAVESGRQAYLAGLAKENKYAQPSSPMEWLLK